MSGRSRVFLAVTVIAVVVIGALGYAFFGTATTLDASRLSRLVVPSTGFAGFKPHPVIKTVISTEKSPSAVVKAAGASHPTETGIFQTEWAGSSKTDEAGIMVQLLPTESEARSVLGELKSDYSAAKKLSAESLTLVGQFTVPALPGVFAARYVNESSKSASEPKAEAAESIYIILFRVHRVAAFVVVDVSSSTTTQQDAASLALSEAEQLRRAEPGLSLTETVRPVSRVLYFALGTLAVVAVVAALPRLRRVMTDRRESKETRARAREHQHVRARGSKVMRRQSVPAWQRPRSSGRRRSGR